jgi:hypothetical protein
MKYPITITFIAMDHSVLHFPSWLNICDVIKKLLSHNDPYDKIFKNHVRGMDWNDKLALYPDNAIHNDETRVLTNTAEVLPHLTSSPRLILC